MEEYCEYCVQYERAVVFVVNGRMKNVEKV